MSCEQISVLLAETIKPQSLLWAAVSNQSNRVRPVESHSGAPGNILAPPPPNMVPLWRIFNFFQMMHFGVFYIFCATAGPSKRRGARSNLSPTPLSQRAWTEKVCVVRSTMGQDSAHDADCISWRYDQALCCSYSVLLIMLLKYHNILALASSTIAIHAARAV